MLNRVEIHLMIHGNHVILILFEIPFNLRTIQKPIIDATKAPIELISIPKQSPIPTAIAS